MPPCSTNISPSYLSAERGEMAQSKVHWSLVAQAFSETDSLRTVTEARGLGLTVNDGWGHDKLTDAVKEHGLQVPPSPDIPE